jgi:iron complex transport system substrate-binding protein
MRTDPAEESTVTRRTRLLTRLIGTACVVGSAALVPAEAQAPSEIPSVDVARGRLGPAAYPRRAMDPNGGTIQLDAAPERIVSLHTNTDEYLMGVVPPERIVGVTSSAYDEDFSRLPDLLAPYEPGIATDAASILALEPDLVIGTLSTSSEVVYALEAAKIPVFRLDTLVTRLEQVAENITVLGYITGQDELARQARARSESEITAIADQCAAPRPRVRIFGHSMTGFSYGDQTLFHDVVRLIGAVNVAAEGGLHTYERIDREDVLAWNPDWVFTWANPGEEAKELQRWMGDPYLGQTSAAITRRIVVSDGRDTRRLSPLITTRARTIADAVCAPAN